MLIFEIQKTSRPWEYEDAVASIACPEGSGKRLVRWHISGVGSSEGTLAVEAVTYDGDFLSRSSE